MDPDPLLLTPGPLTTTDSVKQAMLHDLGSRDERFTALTHDVCGRLLSLVNATENYQCVPLQGSGTFAVEAMIGSLVPRSGKVLNLVNGAYGDRIGTICRYLQREVVTLAGPEDWPNDTEALDQLLSGDPAITHVCAVYCETTSGILNPLRKIAEIVKRYDRQLLIDAMSAFGALPLDVTAIPCTAIAASSNKCLQGVPGLAFVIVENNSLADSRGNAPSLSLDIYDQWQGLQKNGQWRFTPPVQCLLALNQALQELEVEGGCAGRLLRYQDNMVILKSGMRKLGFQTFLEDEVQAPVIVTFHMPADTAFDFSIFYGLLLQQGYVIYPGKLTQQDSFRIGCIGAIRPGQMQSFIKTVATVLDEMGVKNCAPASAGR